MSNWNEIAMEASDVELPGDHVNPFAEPDEYADEVRLFRQEATHELNRLRVSRDLARAEFDNRAN